MIAIVLLTYNRLSYAEKTLRSTLDRITTTHPLAMHLASDGDNKQYISRLRKIAEKYNHITRIDVTNSERGGYGKNYNMSTQITHSHSKYILPLEDDWELTRELDLDPLVRVLDSSLPIESIRLGYLGWTQKLSGYVEKFEGNAYLIFDPNCSEPHIFSGHPRLETVAYQRRVGLWPEGLKPGETEFSVALRKEARINVAWPMDQIHTSGSLFAHIGTIKSYE
jgi:glycosyltransferase involved in cell wall biosynthesis